jgi:hypothetical protein
MKRHLWILLACIVGVEPTGVVRAQVASVASPLRSFDWTYPWKPPGPNNAHWTSPDGVTWTETFPNGRKEVRNVVASTQLGECHGVVAKNADPSAVEILIPDPGCSQMDLNFRSQDGPWHELGPMRVMSTADGPWSRDPAVLQPRMTGCLGWADAWGSRVDVLISRGAIEKARADWTPTRVGTGPMSLRLTYDVRGGHLASLKQVLVEGEPGPLYNGESGYVTLKTADLDYVTVKYNYLVKPAPKSSWHLPLTLDHSDAFRVENSPTIPLAAALLASDHPRNLIEALRFWGRLHVVRETQGLEVTAYDQANGQFSQGGYDVLDHKLRDDLFEQAFARATHGLHHGCASERVLVVKQQFDGWCECNSQALPTPPPLRPAV